MCGCKFTSKRAKACEALFTVCFKECVGFYIAGGIYLQTGYCEFGDLVV